MKETGLDFLHVAGRLYVRAEDALAPLGLSYRDYRALARVARGLASPDTAAHPGPRLVASGLLRSLPPRDTGVARAELTPLGWARLRAATARLEALVGEFERSLSSPEANGLDRLLAKARVASAPLP